MSPITMGEYLFAKRILLLVALAGILARTARGGDLKIPLPGRSKLTPVQRLNREGVDAVRKQQFERASALFYKAYLYDPEDPFTLNNLGYMAEIQGDARRAAEFYSLAARRTTEAVIDQSSSSKLRGRPFDEALTASHDPSMRVNRANLAAVRLLSQGRGAQAEALLEGALTADPHNAYTLNNLGVANEAQGNLEAALQYYSQATSVRSSLPVVVTFNRMWRDKSVSEMAAASALRMEERIQNETPKERAARLNFRGVAAINRNDWQTAAQDFSAAYSLDPSSAFSLNNLGYVAEVNGDPETAQFYYQRARQAQDSGGRVDLATGRSAEGKSLFDVSADNDQKVAAKIAAEAEVRRRHRGPVVLKRRDNSQVTEPAGPTPPSPTAEPAPSSGAQTPNP